MKNHDQELDIVNIPLMEKDEAEFANSTNDEKDYDGEVEFEGPDLDDDWER